ncbi:hypothetical protein ACWGTI_11420 [Mesorhizobium sp. ArgA1]
MADVLRADVKTGFPPLLIATFDLARDRTQNRKPLLLIATL